MKIIHECEQCYLNQLCKNYLYNRYALNEFKPDYYDYDFLSLDLRCTHKHKNSKFNNAIDCDKCVNRCICTLYNSGNKGRGIEYLTKKASEYVWSRFREAFVGTLCCKGYKEVDDINVTGKVTSND